MKRFRNILTCVDLENDSHPALERAAMLAKANEASMKVVALHEGLPAWASLLLPAKAQNWESIVMAEAEERLRVLRAPLEAAGVPVESKLLTGVPHLAIIKEVISERHDLVIKGLELETALENPAIGSMDMHLLRKCPCPLWLIRADAQKPFRRILAAVDPVPGEDENSINIQILELATSLAHQEGCKLLIVRIYQDTGEIFSAKKMDSGELHKYLEHIQMVRLKNDQEIIGRFAGEQGNFDVLYLHGNPSQIITEVTKREEIDLIVLGTVARGGVAGMLMGRTAENVLRQTSCSVLGVKPKDFICPV